MRNLQRKAASLKIRVPLAVTALLSLSLAVMPGAASAVVAPNGLIAYTACEFAADLGRTTCDLWVVDPAAADRVVQATARLVRDQKLTALMVTHSLAQAASLGDRLLLVHRGRIALDVHGAAKRRLSPDDLAFRFARLRSSDQLDEAAARSLSELYI